MILFDAGCSQKQTRNDFWNTAHQQLLPQRQENVAVLGAWSISAGARLYVQRAGHSRRFAVL